MASKLPSVKPAEAKEGHATGLPRRLIARHDDSEHRG
jgi:hypothetical protein